MTDREKVFLVLGATTDPFVTVDICTGLGICSSLIKQCINEGIQFQKIASLRWDGNKYVNDRFEKLIGTSWQT